MKRLFLAFAATLSFIGYAQIVSNVDFFPEKDNVIVTYSLASPTPSISLFFSRNGGDWVQLKQVSGDVGNNVQPGNNRIVWDIYKEMPDGVADSVKFAVVSDYREPSKYNLPPELPNWSAVIRGYKAYVKKRTNYKSVYAGDIREGNWSSATDSISYSYDIIEYDFVTGESETIYSFGWSGRISRKELPGKVNLFHNFPVDKEPYYDLHIDNKGRVCLNKTVIVE